MYTLDKYNEFDLRKGTVGVIEKPRNFLPVSFVPWKKEYFKKQKTFPSFKVVTFFDITSIRL